MQNILLLIFESKCCRYKLQRNLKKTSKKNSWKHNFGPNLQRAALANAGPQRSTLDQNESNSEVQKVKETSVGSSVGAAFNASPSVER